MKKILGILTTLLVLVGLVVVWGAGKEALANDDGISISEITAGCAQGGGVSGTVRICNNSSSTQRVEFDLKLYQHFPGDPAWYPTGDTYHVSVDVPAGECVNVDYTMGSNSSAGANSLRVENTLTPEKSESFGPCGPPPTATTPPPTATTPAPTGTTPVPTGTTPAPTGTTPVPTGTTPAPTGTTPSPPPPTRTPDYGAYVLDVGKQEWGKSEDGVLVEIGTLKQYTGKFAPGVVRFILGVGDTGNKIFQVLVARTHQQGSVECNSWALKGAKEQTWNFGPGEKVLISIHGYAGGEGKIVCNDKPPQPSPTSAPPSTPTPTSTLVVPPKELPKAGGGNVDPKIALAIAGIGSLFMVGGLALRRRFSKA